MIIKVSLVKECVGTLARIGTQKTFFNQLPASGTATIEISDILKYFYKKGKIDTSSDTLCKIIQATYGAEGVTFIKNNSRIPPEKLAACLDLLHLIRSLDSVDHIREFSQLLADVVQCDDPTQLIQCIKTDNSALFLIILAKTNIDSILEELENLPEDQQVAIWKHKKFFYNSALSIAIISQKNLASVLETLKKLSSETQALIWQQKSYYMINSLWQQKNYFNSSPFLLAMGTGMDITPVIESIGNLTPDQRFTLWNDADDEGNTVLIKAFLESHRQYNHKNIPVILSALVEFSTVQQLSLWQKNWDTSRNPFCLALQHNKEKYLKNVLTALSNLSPEQQFILCNRYARQLMLNRYLDVKRTLILNVINQFTPEQRLLLLMQGAPHYVPLISTLFYWKPLVELFMQDADLLNRPIWPQGYDFQTWEFYSVFKAVLRVGEERCHCFLFETLKQVPLENQLFFWLGMNEEKDQHHLITSALECPVMASYLKKMISSWPLLEQLRLGKHLIANRKFYKSRVLCDTILCNAESLLKSIETVIDKSIDELDNLDETQNTIKNCLTNMSASSDEKIKYTRLGKKINIALEIEKLKRDKSHNFLALLTDAIKDKQSPLYQAINKHRAPLNSLFITTTRSARKLEKNSDKTRSKKSPAICSANFGENPSDDSDTFSL